MPKPTPPRTLVPTRVAFPSSLLPFIVSSTSCLSLSSLVYPFTSFLPSFHLFTSFLPHILPWSFPPSFHILPFLLATGYGYLNWLNADGGDNEWRSAAESLGLPGGLSGTGSPLTGVPGLFLFQMDF
jgi:hypothetical protein